MWTLSEAFDLVQYLHDVIPSAADMIEDWHEYADVQMFLLKWLLSVFTDCTVFHLPFILPITQKKPIYDDH